MRVIAAAETDAGICKPINQDGYCIKIAQTPAGQVALAAVCDGMGGLERANLRARRPCGRFPHGSIRRCRGCFRSWTGCVSPRCGEP